MPKYYFKRLEYLNALTSQKIADPVSKQSAENSNVIKWHLFHPKGILKYLYSES